MNKLNTNTIQVYIEKLHVRGVSSSDVLKKLQSVDKFFDWAHKSGHIKENIYKQMKGGIDKGMIGAHHDAPVQLVGAKRDLPNYLIGSVTPRPYNKQLAVGSGQSLDLKQAAFIFAITRIVQKYK